LVEADPDVGLGSEIVYLVWLDLLQQMMKPGGIGKVAVVKVQRHAVLMRVRVDMVKTVCVKRGCPAYNSVCGFRGKAKRIPG
jgi:hypothetical protein